MSGIVCTFRRDGAPTAPGALEPALAALSSRGRDGRHVWAGGPASLGCVQNRTTPQSATEVLPYHDRARGVVVVHDARLDNREELANQLHLPGTRLPEIPDGALIVAAWSRWGERCPEHLAGDFAIALWDERERTLFCARDHLGTRLLFCYTSPVLFACASELRGVLAVPGVPRRLNPQKVAEFLIDVVPDVATTFHAGVVRLRPGESRLVTADAEGVRRYFRLALPEHVHRGSAAEVASGFREVLTTSIRQRLVAMEGRPVGAQLSGGLDSSSIVCIARDLRRREAGDPLPTFSCVFPRTPAADESAYVRAVVDEGGVAPHAIDADAITPLTDLDRVLDAFGEPFHGAPLPYQWTLFRTAAELGVAVILDGYGGDSVVSYGLHYLAELAWRGRFLRLAREVRGVQRLGWLPPRTTLRMFVLEPSIPRWLLAARRAVLGRTARLPQPTFVAPELARRTALLDHFEAFWHSRPVPRGEREHHLADVEFHLPADVIETSAAAFGLEPRFPYLDRRVIEYCLAVPPAQKIEHGVTRMLSRRALAGLLTPAVAARYSKATPTQSLLRSLYVVDRPRLDELLLGPAAERAAPYLDLDALRRVYRQQQEQYRDGAHRWASTGDWQAADQLRSAAVLIRWLESTAVTE
jgi:asparagine synthase (glutamine-hydrolysing)